MAGRITEILVFSFLAVAFAVVAGSVVNPLTWFFASILWGGFCLAAGVRIYDLIMDIHENTRK